MIIWKIQLETRSAPAPGNKPADGACHFLLQNYTKPPCADICLKQAADIIVALKQVGFEPCWD